jgi:membrane protein YdbS with pleckstrin-like domain
VDVTSGPIDRALGLVHVSLHVAGSAGAVLTIPGLAPAEAETLREALLESAKVS